MRVLFLKLFKKKNHQKKKPRGKSIQMRSIKQISIEEGNNQINTRNRFEYNIVIQIRHKQGN